MLAAPAQAETWSCSYHDEVKKGPMPFSFVHNGGNFDVLVFNAAFWVVHENSKVIQLHRAWHKEKVPQCDSSLAWRTMHDPFTDRHRNRGATSMESITC